MNVSDAVWQQRFNSDIKTLDLPAMPAAALKIIELSNDERSAANDLAKVIETDPALASRLLRLANSAAYGLSSPVSSISRAVVVQGFTSTRELALHLLIHDRLIAGESQTFDRLFFWQHCLFVAFCGRLIGQQIGHPDPEQLYISGLLHDIGKLALETAGKISYSEFLRIPHRSESDLVEAERAFFGISHDELGNWCAEQWRLPRSVAAVLGGHHGARQVCDEPMAAQTDAAIIALADHIAWVHGLGSSRIFLHASVQGHLLHQIDIRSLDLPALLEKTDAEIHRVAAFYRLDFPSIFHLRSHLLERLLSLDEQNRSPLADPEHLEKSLTAPHQSLDPAHFIPETLHALCDELHAEKVILWRIDPLTRSLSRVTSFPQKPVAAIPHEIPESLITRQLREQLREREAALLSHDQNAELLDHLHCDKALIAPVMHHGRLFGVLWLDNGLEGAALTAEILQGLITVSRELGTALSNSVTFSREKRKAELDGLTGLHNRGSLDRLLEQALARYQSGGPVVILGLVDIDNFKQFNDNFGHQAGDDVLKVVAQALSGLIRPGDILGRYGGDEFLFALIGTDTKGAVRYAERVRREVERRGQVLSRRFTGRAITISIGMAGTTHGRSQLAEVVAAADQALYQAKNSSRNQTVLAPPVTAVNSVT